MARKCGPDGFHLPPLLAALLAASLALESCAPSRLPVRLDLDEGFSTLFPAMNQRLAQDFPRLEDGEPETPDPEPGEQGILVASPFKALEHLGDPHSAGFRDIVVPLAPPALSENPRIHPVDYDMEKAYAAAGTTAGSLAKRREREGRADFNCSVVFQENLGRDRAALDAFTEAFRRSSGGMEARIVDFAPDYETVDPSGAAKAAIREAASEDAGIVFLAMDAQAQAQAQASEDRSRLYFADTILWDASLVERAAFSFLIEGRQEALASQASTTARALSKGGKPQVQPVGLRVLRRAGKRR